MGGNRALRTYLVIQGVVSVGSFLLPYPIRGVAHLLIVISGVVALIVAIGRKRPSRRTAWWLVAASGSLTYGSAIVVVVTYGLRGAATVHVWGPVVLGVSAMVMLAGGLAVLGRRRSDVSGAGWVDALDAWMTAVGVYLLTWIFYTNPRVTMSTSTVVTLVAVAVPVSALLVFTTAVKLALAGVWRTWSGRMLLLAIVAGLAAAGLTAYPAGAQAVQFNLALTVAWLSHGVLLGATGVAADFADVGATLRLPAIDLPPWRMALFLLLALLVPVDLAVEFVHAGPGVPDAPTVLVPVICAAVIFLLLVVRLGLVARVAQGRAAELARQTHALERAVADQKELQGQLSYRALHDPLTGLANRSVLTDRMEWIHDTFGTPGHPPGRGQALLMLDLDGFKYINDTFGHPVGDQVLVDVARRVLSTVPDETVVVRLGGDEFAVLLEDTSAFEARQRADEIMEAVRSPYFVGGRELFLSASIGLLVSAATMQPPNSSEALRDVDQALYAAKTAGRNRIVQFHPRLRAERLDQARISAGLRNALARDEFVLHYQPIVALRGGAIVAAEALLRWRRGPGDLVSPGEFIPVAEQVGLIVDIGAWVVRQACHDARAWYVEHGIPVGVNVSGRQLDDPSFSDVVLAALADAGLPGPALSLELTESSLIATTTDLAVHAQLNRLRDNGVRVAIDDFGTGYSSLSYISRLPVDLVKIDSSFTQSPADPATPRQTWDFLRAILELISSLRLEAIAEGVETQEQADALRGLNCPFAQGYYFSRPVPADQFDRLMRTSVTTGRSR